MVQVNISTLKNELSAYLRKVKKGEEVLVMDRDRPVAKLVAVTPNEHILDNDEAHLAELERRGIITRSTKKWSKDWFEKHPPIKLASGVSAVEILLKEREESP